ncbi:MAG TPA: type II secretion system protein [Tepidisphaeraceae bacterium]|nr:type II secretion system protein [Tepidisphaeraceae bacterium]
MTLPPSAPSAGINSRRPRHAFSLTELLVVVGIIAGLIAILVPFIGHARKQAEITRTRADLNTIAAALEAYKADFGDYPRVEYTPGIANVAGSRPEPPTGAQILCWALIGPAPMAEKNPLSTNHAIQDGADGPGFRTRPPLAGVDGVLGTTDDVPQGRVYGPYIPVDKFKIGDPSPIPSTSQLMWSILDSNHRPILYFPASPKKLDPTIQTGTAAYIGQTTAASPTPVPLPLTAIQTFVWDLTDNLGVTYTDDTGSSATAFVRNSDTYAVVRISAMLGDMNHNGRIDTGETAATTGPYILWAAGPDGNFGPDSQTPTTTDTAKCDDVTNFTPPGQ